MLLWSQNKVQEYTRRTYQKTQIVKSSLLVEFMQVHDFIILKILFLKTKLHINFYALVTSEFFYIIYEFAKLGVNLFRIAMFVS
jgi:hypothetical protein